MSRDALIKELCNSMKPKTKNESDCITETVKFEKQNYARLTKVNDPDKLRYYAELENLINCLNTLGDKDSKRNALELAYFRESINDFDIEERKKILKTFDTFYRSLLSRSAHALFLNLEISDYIKTLKK